MPVLKSRESPGLLGMLRLLAFAVFPVTKVWGDGILEWSLPAGRRTPPDYSPPVGAFYRIPVVKGTIRLSIHVLYIAFMSYTSMEASRSPDVRSADLLALDEPKFHQGGGQDKLWVNFVSWLWTVSLALDEWYAAPALHPTSLGHISLDHVSSPTPSSPLDAAWQVQVHPGAKYLPGGLLEPL